MSVVQHSEQRSLEDYHGRQVRSRPVLNTVGGLLGVLAHSDQQGAAVKGDVHRQNSVPLHCVVHPQPKVIHIRDLQVSETLPMRLRSVLSAHAWERRSPWQRAVFGTETRLSPHNRGH